MKLSEIPSHIHVIKAIGNLDTEFTGIQMDSRKIQSGDLFICVPGKEGFLEDRHQYAPTAVSKGAIALIVEWELDVEVPQIVVKDARYAMAVISAHFFKHPSRHLKLIGITGTNGKTTTSFIIEKILADYGYRTGLMGNNGVKINQILYPTDINTQEPPVLQKNLDKMRNENVDYCVMEVTSQGVDMGRVMGCHFKSAVFTNLTQDHLDYHGSFEEYRCAKGLFFSRLGNTFDSSDKKYAILNADDESFNFIKKQTTAEVITYGINSQADVMAKELQLSSTGIRFLLCTFKGEVEIELNLVGKFNVYNSLAAITSSLLENIPLTSIKESLKNFPAIDGRMEIIDEGQDFLVVVDFAHTPDALENVLSSLTELSKGKIITVFGCGGDRDPSKRPLMAEIASKYSDEIILTSDNPRTEDPTIILSDIEKGISSSVNCVIVENRYEAIKLAIGKASSKDIVLIAGKGHETYQILKDQTIHFDDREEARRCLRVE